MNSQTLGEAHTSPPRTMAALTRTTTRLPNPATRHPLAMNPTQIDLIRSSFSLVQPIAAQAAAMFYDRLFERDPSIGPLFRGNMAQQGERLMAMIGGAVLLLDQPQTLEKVLTDLGRRHVGYGVRDEHYPAVGGALLDTLAAGLGPVFTPAHRAAWAAMYQRVSDVMQAAAAQAPVGSSMA